MPRICVLCRKSQSQSFSVFSFPSSLKQRIAWFRIIMEAKPDLVKDKHFMETRLLKNGICEHHFLRSEISKGKKRRLSKEAVPSINVSTSQKCNYLMKLYKSLVTNQQHSLMGKELTSKDSTSIDSTSKDSSLYSLMEDYPSDINCILGTDALDDSSVDQVLPECTVKIEIEDQDSLPSEVRQTIVDNIFGDEEGVCFCCGVRKSRSMLVSFLKERPAQEERSFLELLSTLFHVSKEKLITHSTYACRRCLKTVEDMLELRKTFLCLLTHLKTEFLNTSKRLENSNNFDTCLEIDGNKTFSRDNSKDEELAPLISSRKRRLGNNDRKYTCAECDDSFTTMATLTEHDCSDSSKSCTINSPEFCKTCHKKNCFKHSSVLESNPRKQIYDCPHCDRYITSKVRLERHIYKFHGIGEAKKKLFLCKVCDKSFCTKPGLTYHERVSHGTGKTYMCEVCNRVFPFLMLYKNHKLFAHGKKSIICETCGEMFFNVAKLNEHINSIHRKAMSWICNLCNHKFTTASAHRQHILLRHKRTLYNCPHCGSRFVKKYSLTQHLWKHNVFVCQKCDAKYDNSSFYISHMAQMHKLDVSAKFISKRNRNSPTDVHMNTTDDGSNSMTTSTAKEDNSIVINDILMASNDFENSNLQHLSFQPENGKERDEDKATFDPLSNVHSLHFDTVDALEIQSVTNDSIELEKDVSLINVQMLDDVIRESDRDLKNVLASEKEQRMGADNDIQDLSLHSPKLISHVGPTAGNEKTAADEVLKKMNDLRTSPSTAKSNEDTLVMVEPLGRAKPLESLPPVILQPVKKSDWAIHHTLDNPSTASVGPVIRSLAVTDHVPDDSDPPITREIDITIASEDEDTKIMPLDKSVSDEVNNMDGQDIPTLSVDFDGKGELHYKYMMYFETTSEKS